MVISGGTGTLLGPIVGGALVVIVKDIARAYIARWNFVLGAIFVAIHPYARRDSAGLGAAVPLVSGEIAAAGY
jgi:ABC-type branched-subunit amino acid transport system permease subunit